MLILKQRHKARISAIFIMFIIFFTCLTSLKGQNYKIPHKSYSSIKQQKEFEKFAHIKDKEQFSLGCGIVKNGYNIDAAYGKYLSKVWLFSTDFFYENVKLGLTTLNAFYLSPEFNYTIDKVTNQFFIDMKAGAVGWKTRRG